MWLITALILAATSFYLFLKYIFTYWWRKGFPYIAPTIPIGNMKSTITGKTSFGLNIWEHYKHSEDPFTGIYTFTTPALLIRDPDLVRNILVSDFSTFMDHGFHCNGEVDPMSEQLLSLCGQDWKNLRNKISPAFSAGKLKVMFPTILEVGSNMQKHMLTLAEKNSVVDMKDMSLRYTIDIISNVIVGFEVNSFENANNAFQVFHKRNNSATLYETFTRAMMVLNPKMLDLFKIKSTPKYVEDFMYEIVKQTIVHREENNVQRQDLMQLLLQLRNAGEVKSDGDWKISTSATKSLSIDQVAANMYIFYVAGNETSAATISFTLHELAHNPKIMKKAVDEIKDVLKKHNGQITFDSISEVKYLDLCIQETIRKYPALPILNRITTKDYAIPNSNLTLEKGTSVILPLIGLHRDEKYFPNPEGYDPERFLPENKGYDERVFLPFGDGPRNCIGMRIGKVVVKCGLINLLSKFNFESLDKYEVDFDTTSFGLSPRDGVRMKVSL